MEQQAHIDDLILSYIMLLERVVKESKPNNAIVFLSNKHKSFILFLILTLRFVSFDKYTGSAVIIHCALFDFGTIR